MNWWLIISTGLALAAWLMLVVWYWIRAKWWKTLMGQNMMGLSILVALSLALRLASQITNPHFNYRPWQVVLGVVIYGLLAFFGFQRVYFVEQSQREIKAAQAWKLYTRGTPPGLQNGDSMKDILTPAARKIAYRIYAVVGLVLGTIQVGIGATPNTEQPAWLTASFAVLAFLAGAFGFVADANVNEDVAAPGE